MRVIGVFRSCDMAVRTRVRSAMKRDSRLCIVLKGRAARRTSTGPASGSGGRSMSVPSSSAAVASEESGAVAQRTAISESNTTLPRRISSVSATRVEIAATWGGRKVSNVTRVPSRSETWTVKNAPSGERPCMPCPPMWPIILDMPDGPIECIGRSASGARS